MCGPIKCRAKLGGAGIWNVSTWGRDGGMGWARVPNVKPLVLALNQWCRLVAGGVCDGFSDVAEFARKAHHRKGMQDAMMLSSNLHTAPTIARLQASRPTTPALSRTRSPNSEQLGHPMPHGLPAPRPDPRCSLCAAASERRV